MHGTFVKFTLLLLSLFLSCSQLRSFCSYLYFLMKGTLVVDFELFPFFLNCKNLGLKIPLWALPKLHLTKFGCFSFGFCFFNLVYLTKFWCFFNFL